MFSSEPRCIYRANQLGEVICQLRFPEIPSIGSALPAAFLDAIRDEFPRFSSRQDCPPPKITGTPGNMVLENQPSVINYQFVSEDGMWKVNLTNTFISLACANYTRWEDFARKLDKPLANFIKLYKPAIFDRVGLRYVNFISRQKLNLENTPFRELIQSYYLGPLAMENMNEAKVNSNTVDLEMDFRGSYLKLHAGPGMVTKNGQQDPERKFIFDQDQFMTNIPVKMSIGALNTLHLQAFAIFRGAITDRLHNAMEPETI
jgi:uncharacterized protein (TIGR04255 family)